VRRSFSFRPRLAVLLLAGLTQLACGDRTSLLVRVESPLAIPDDIDQLDFHVVGTTTSMSVDRSFPGLTATWPHTLALRPGPIESRDVTITVTALHAGTFVVQRVVHATFVPGLDQTVLVILPAECRGVMCDAGVDCVAGRCEDARPDAGPHDSGPPHDGGDAGVCLCTGSADCDDMIGCTMDVCTDCACEHRTDDTLCADGFTCDPVAGCPLRTCASDADCDDHRPCNGTETCATGTMTCAAGTPIDCDDGDVCTTDLCDDSVHDGMCNHTTRDADGDGHGDATCMPGVGIVADDCDDTNAMVLPGVPEDCNGLDDDCANGCDDGFTCCRGTMGPCMTSCGTTGNRTCNATCGWSVCSPPPETCNAVDDDCNGAADDVFACVQGVTQACTTSCGSAGMRTCDSGCAWSACAAIETCNGLDDDCNGMPDDTFACVGGTSAGCATSCGSTGTLACSATTCTASATCVPPAEGCNGIDDDCDTRVDETVECTAGTMRSCMTTCGSTGNQTCSATCTFPACTPPAEICNGADDNCDGRIDETFACVPGAVGTCMASCGTMGSRTCTASCTWGACTPPIEACNGVDDNCNSMCDESFSCCSGTSDTCTTSCGTTGTRTCGTGTCVYGSCFPPPETCNGMDDDCNGTCDDGTGLACCAGRTGSCTTSCGSTGSRVCSGSCAWGACAPPPEACGGGDDNCDGVIDEGFACVPGAVASCTTGCGSTGTHTCDASCVFGACNPPTEVCNTVDDNCDGTIDEGCGSCVSCPGATTVSSPGGRFTVPTTSATSTGSCGGAGSEHTLTFTLPAASDVFITTHQAGSIDTVIYVRSCSCAGTEVACNDNADGRTTSALHLTNLPSGTYDVFVDSASAAMGTSIPVDIYISAPGTESDRCGNPTFIPAASTFVSGSTCGFTDDATTVPVAGDCPFLPGPGVDRIYYFYLPTSRTISMNACNSGTVFDTLLFARNVCTDSGLASQVGCDDDGCSGMDSCAAGRRSSHTQTLGPGLFYFFADGYGDPACPCGNFRYNLTGF
jgi:hypothetical protein